MVTSVGWYSMFVADIFLQFCCLRTILPKRRWSYEFLIGHWGPETAVQITNHWCFFSVKYIFDVCKKCSLSYCTSLIWLFTKFVVKFLWAKYFGKTAIRWWLNFKKKPQKKIFLTILDDVFPARTTLYKVHFEDLVLRYITKSGNLWYTPLDCCEY